VKISREGIVNKILESFYRERFPQAILLFGPAGTSKFSLGKELAQAILCEGSDFPCPGCPSCRMFSSSIHPSYLELRGNEKGVIRADGIRSLKRELHLKGFFGKKRVIFIHPGEGMTKSAGNSLLKMLEEPPRGVHFIITASSPGKIPLTVRSRCILLTVPPFGEEELKKYGKSEYPERKSNEIARAAEESFGHIDLFRELASGSMRGGGEIYRAIVKGDRKKIGEIASTFRDEESGRRGMIILKRVLLDLLLLSIGEKKSIIIDEIREGKDKIQKIDHRKIEEFFHILSSLERMPPQANRALVCETILLSLSK